MTPAERLDALYERSPGVPSASALAKAGVRVSTHGRVDVNGKITRGSVHGNGRRVLIDGKRICVNKLVNSVWGLASPHSTDFTYEVWSHP
jgi:hypothetical protein